MSSKVLGTSEVVRRIGKLRAAMAVGVKDEALAQLLLARIKGRFMATVSPQGVPWVGLSTQTVKRRRSQPGKYTRPTQPLYGTGRLYRAINIVRAGQAAGAFVGSTGLGIRIGVTDTSPVAEGRMSPAEYGRLHNYGIGQEKRQFLGLSALDLEAVRRNVKKRLEHAVEA